MHKKLYYDLVVIGGGPAGLAAAIEARKSRINKILLIERNIELGGILQQCIHNGFGLHLFRKDLTGPEYAEHFINELKDLHIECLLDTMVLGIGAGKVIEAVNRAQGLESIHSKAIILAMGCRERTRGALHIPGSRPAGIFTAGTAQRLVNIDGLKVGERIVILGSGDIGLIMARRLTLEGATVEAVVEVMSYPGGLNRNIVQCLHDYDIPLLLSHTVVDIHGRNRLTGVDIARVDQKKNIIPGTKRHIECDTMLLSAGLIPENELSVHCGVELDPVTQGPIVDDGMQTTVGGIFACGNVVHVHDVVDFVTKESGKAGRNAAEYIRNADKATGPVIKVVSDTSVRYIVPQRVNIERHNTDLEFYMRSRNVHDRATLVISLDGKTIKTVKKRRVVPGEMQRIKLKGDLLQHCTKDSMLSLSVI